ncbi:DsbA family protein [Chloroflexota bacterium]
MGLYRAERLKRDYSVDVEWKAFELKPGTPLEGIPRPQKPGEKNELSPNAKLLSEELGLKMQRPNFIPCSRPALEAAEYAKEHGVFDQFHLAVFKAYWEDARNIGHISVLRDLAGKCGMDGNGLELRLLDHYYSSAINRQIEEALELGITLIPSFIIGNHLIEGPQPYELFQRIMSLANPG